MNVPFFVSISFLIALNLTLCYSHHTHRATSDFVSSNFTCSCDWRYLKHYETKGCKAIYRENSDCKCPLRFQCPKLEVDPDVCRLNGQTHRLDEKVQTSNPCEICHCRRDYGNGKASIQCIPLECPSLLHSPAPGCYLYYEDGKCCPTEKCGENGKNTPRNKVCTYNGKDYNIGQKIYSEEDPCLICRCTENWTGMNNASCNHFNCDLEKDIHKLSKGCVPIYHDKTCCPIEYHCTEQTTEDENEEPGFEGPDLCQEEPMFGSCHESFTKYYYNNRKETCEEFLFSGCKGNRNIFASPEECEAVCGPSRNVNGNVKREKENMCYFDHRFHSVGDILDIKHPTNCVTCTCLTPPDFTCVHRSCPGPPNNDYENCQANYKPNACCAEYNCTVKEPKKPVSYKAETSLNPCPEVNCDKPSCRIVKLPGQCPVCECHEMVCEKPLCEDGCEVESWDEESKRCPGCRCTSESRKRAQQRRTRQTACFTPVCNPGCHLITKADGCPSCKCEQCIPPKCICPTTVCEDGCHLDRNVTYGQCPVCVCTRLTRGRYDDLCLPPRCFCSKPNCNDGCEIDTDVRDGRCPGCKCKPSSFISSNPRSTPSPRKPLCPPTNRCDDHCKLMLNQQGCAYCECPEKRMPQRCPQEECPSNCKLEMHPSNGQCPICICKFDKDDSEREYETISRQNLQPSSSDTNRRNDMCPSLNCPDCPKTTDNKGCLQCDCRLTNRPVTSRPDNRRVSSTTTRITTSTLPPCPEEICQAPYCRSVLGDDGCPSCQCSNPTPECVRPECPSNCALKNKPGECPTCVCPTRSPPQDRSQGRPSTRTCPNESCHGIKCKLIPGENGCQKCICEEPCRPLTCDRGCTKIDNPGIGKCPYCLCSFS